MCRNDSLALLAFPYDAVGIQFAAIGNSQGLFLYWHEIEVLQSGTRSDSSVSRLDAHYHILIVFPHARWQLGSRHVISKIESRFGTLVVTTCCAVGTVVRVFLQTVNVVDIGCVVGCESHDTRVHSVYLPVENQFLAPVTYDVAPELSSFCVARLNGIVRLFSHLYQASVSEVADVGIISASVRRINSLPVQFIVPPYTFCGEISNQAIYFVALGIKYLIPVHG